MRTVKEEPEEYGTSHSNRTSLACVINAEVASLLAVLRRNIRWDGRCVLGDDQLEHSLIESLKALRKQIFSRSHPWHTINPAVYLQPFLDVIRSDEIGAPITGVALSSVYKILTLDVINEKTVKVEDAMNFVVATITSCQFEVTDPYSEEAILLKILQILLACMKSKASVTLSNQHVCTIVNTCFRIVHQAKGELLQHIARHTMHELITCIFSHLPDVHDPECSVVNGSKIVKRKNGGPDNHYTTKSKQLESRTGCSEFVGRDSSVSLGSTDSTDQVANLMENNTISAGSGKGSLAYDLQFLEPYGGPCMVEVFHFLCSLLNVVEYVSMDPRSDSVAFDEDLPLFALNLINSAVELGGKSIKNHPRLLSLVQDELFRNLMQFGMSRSPVILSMVCSVVLNLYHHLRTELKLQLEAFFSYVILRLAQSRYCASYQQQEVAIGALIDFCRQKKFMTEMYANFDCDITCSNVFEDIANLLSMTAFPLNSSLTTIHILALDGLISVIQGMAERIGNGAVSSKKEKMTIEDSIPFWKMKCENYGDPKQWVPFVRQKKYIKKKLMVGADHFNHDPKKGIEFLQGTNVLSEKLDPKIVACFLRYTAGLDKNLVGDFLGNPDDFCVQVLHEFAQTFDFQTMNMDDALRLFLETFRLPGESQKIQRVLEAFSEIYYEQSPNILANKDAALVLSYSLIMLNTDQHNVQVKKKMTEEDFIRNNRRINGGNDLPREFLSELYQSICMNEIRTTPDKGAGLPEMTPSRWAYLMQKSKKISPFIVSDSNAYLDHDMFAVMSGPAIAAISVVFDHAETEDVYQTCIDGFLAVAKISACRHLGDLLDDLVVSLSKFTTLLNPPSSEDPILSFGDDIKARMATVTIFTIANRYGDYLCTGWRNIVESILKLHKLGLLPTRVATDVANEVELSAESEHGKLLAKSLFPVPLQPMAAPRRSYGLMGRVNRHSSLDNEESRFLPTEEQIAAYQGALQTIQKCHIDNIFTESKSFRDDSLLSLARALIWAGRRSQRGNSSLEDEDAAVFCLELLIALTLNNWNRIMLLWQCVYEHIANIVHSIITPCALVENAVFGLLRICQRLLPYKEILADELLKSLQLVSQLDSRIADAYSERITKEVSQLVKANAPLVRSLMGWHIIMSLLSASACHPEASEAGFDALLFIVANGAHLSPDNYLLCVDAVRQFAESPVGQAKRSIRAIDLMTDSVDCLARWSTETREAIREEEATKLCQDTGELWLRLAQELQRVCLDVREEVRNHALSSLQKCLAVNDRINIPNGLWSQCFDVVIFTMLDDLLEIAQGNSQTDYRNMEGTLITAVKLMSELFKGSLNELVQLATFSKTWIGVLSRMKKCMNVKVRGKKTDELQELVLELLKETLLKMKNESVLLQRSTSDGDSLWELTWPHVNSIAPSLQSAIFPDQGHTGPGLDPGPSKE
ncbi:hypothetical protein K2173_017055 [Erythroxylum novogranatense]|uniref:SEC7 domain-containing protein n=1 Tax=Erythroxylum novogranatense TaxID=1862640 RepID=A0AAV8U8U7_9ROSI|nr:hypothetical protein K2173_017055 [Erythroxylum novogranatense]